MVQDFLATRRRGSIVIEKQVAVLLTGKESRRDRVYPDVVRRPLPREELREIQQRCLGGRIGHHPRKWQMAGNARDVDDAALAVFLHRRAEFLAW